LTGSALEGKTQPQKVEESPGFMNLTVLVTAILSLISGIALTWFKYWLDRRAERRMRLTDEAAAREVARQNLLRAGLWRPDETTTPQQIREYVHSLQALEAELRQRERRVELPEAVAAPRAAPWLRWAALVLIVAAVVLVLLWLLR
jgi:hypothetical protein